MADVIRKGDRIQADCAVINKQATPHACTPTITTSALGATPANGHVGETDDSRLHKEGANVTRIITTRVKGISAEAADAETATNKSNIAID
jgi:hypothetical protein